MHFRKGVSASCTHNKTVMMRFCTFLVILIAIWDRSSGAAVFDASKCSDGCKTSQDCPANAHCVAVTQDTNCGLCLCEAGYKTEGGQCVPNDKSKNTKSSNKRGSHEGNGGSASEEKKPVVDPPPPAQQDTTTAAAPTTPTTTGTTTQGAPPGPTALNCADFACSPTIDQSSDDDPMKVRAQLFNESSNCKRKLNVAGRPCKTAGGPVCYGVYCLTVEPGKDYCICPFYRVDHQCAIDKPGSCESANGQIPSNGFKAQNKRYRHKTNPDTGSVYGRHFASSFDDCVKSCQWAGGNTGCRSVNYGTLAGQPVCELLSIAVTKGSPLEAWLVDAPGWQYALVSSS